MAVLQLNCGRRAIATQFCVDYQYDIGLIQEPNLKSINDLKSVGNLIVADDRPRACVVARDNFCLLPQFSNRDIVVAVKSRTMVCSFYMAMEDAEETIAKLEEALAYASSREWDILAAGDANARSPMWGSPSSCSRGETIENLAVNYSLKVANVGSEPTFQTGVGTSVIDVALTNMQVERWQTRPDLAAGSDHVAITYQMTEIAPPEEPVRKRDWKKANWSALIEQLEIFANRTYVLWSEELLDQATDAMNAAVQRALDKHVPWRTIKKKPRVWWDENCTKARTAYRRAKTRHRRNGNDESLRNLVEAKDAYSRAIYKAKDSSWRAFVHETKDLGEFAKLKKILCKAKAAEMRVLRRPDGSYADSMKESIGILLKEHFPGSQPWSKFSRHSNEAVQIQPLDWITVQTVKAAAMTFKQGKAHGPDEISVELIQRFGPKMLAFLCQLYTASIRLGYTPRAWRTGKTVFINKAAKKDYAEPRAWRPITLLNLPWKVFERCVQWKLEDHFRLHPLSDRQYAFRKGRSCDHALSRVVNKLEKAKEQGQFGLYVGLDITGAYDNIKVAALADAMRKRGIDEEIVRWTEQFLHERKIKAEIKGEAAEIKASVGTSQGAVLSTILWSIAYDELLKEYDTGPVELTGYADDGCWVVTGLDCPTLFHLMQKAIDKAVAWADRMGLKFCPRKTAAMIVTNKRKYKSGKLYLYGNEITLDSSVQVLGVTIDSKVNFNKHVEERTRKAKRILMAAKAALARTWGPRPELTRWLITGVVLPILSYASHVWINALSRKMNVDKLNAIQRLGLMIIAPTRRSTPTAGLEIIYNVTPIELAIRERAKLNMLRIKPLLGNIGNWIPKTRTYGHMRVLDHSLEGIPTPGDVTTPARLEGNFSVEIGDGKPRQADVEVYTDGSRSENCAGVGVCVYRQGNHTLTISERLERTSAFLTEVYALELACKALEGTMSKDIRIMSDNQAAIRAVHAASSNNPWVIRAAEALSKLGKWNHLTVGWIEGHKGHAGNERADEAAKRGAMSSRLADLSPPITSAETKARVREITLDMWKSGFNTDKRFRQTKLFVRGPDKAIWKNICKLGRERVGRLVRFVTGHAYVLRTEAVMQGVEESADLKCRLCESSVETAEHIVRECPTLSQRRFDLLGTHIGADIEETAALAEFLDCADVVALEDEVRLFPPFGNNR